MASERARDVLRRIDIGEGLLTERASREQVRTLARVRRHLEEALREMPVSGFGLYRDGNQALYRAIGEVSKAEREAFSRYVQARDMLRLSGRRASYVQARDMRAMWERHAR